MQRILFVYLGVGLFLSWPLFGHAATPIIHDAEYAIIEAQLARHGLLMIRRSTKS